MKPTISKTLMALTLFCLNQITLHAMETRPSKAIRKLSELSADNFPEHLEHYAIMCSDDKDVALSSELIQHSPVLTAMFKGAFQEAQTKKSQSIFSSTQMYLVTGYLRCIEENSPDLHEQLELSLEQQPLAKILPVFDYYCLPSKEQTEKTSPVTRLFYKVISEKLASHEVLDEFSDQGTIAGLNIQNKPPCVRTIEKLFDEEAEAEFYGQGAIPDDLAQTYLKPFNYNIIRRFDHNITALLTGHIDYVNSAAFSPDGNSIVTASYDRTARVWTQQNGLWKDETLKGHTDFVNSAAFNSDGKSIVTGSRDNTARVWTQHNGSWKDEILNGHTHWINSAAFSPDGNSIVTASEDKTARVWTQQNGSWKDERLKGHTDTVFFPAFSPDGNSIVTTSLNRIARVWTQHNGSWKDEVLEGHKDLVDSAAFSPDGKSIVTASRDKTARVWTQQNGSWKAEILSGHKDLVVSAAFSPDSKSIVTGSRDKTARVWRALDLVGEENITAKILLLLLLKRGDTKAVTRRPHLKELFTSLAPEAQKYLEKKYDIKAELEERALLNLFT